MNSQQDQSQKTKATLDQCLAEVRFAQAAELGRSGQYAEAEALLVKNGKLPEEPRELDLLARIAAQQGQFELARRMWETALKYDSKNTTYRDCLTSLSDLENGTEPDDSRRPLLLWGAVLFGLVVVGFVFFNFLPQNWRAQPDSAHIPPPASQQSHAAAAEPTSKVDAVSTTPASIHMDLSAALAPVQADLARLQQTQEEKAKASAARLQAMETNQAMLLQQQNSTVEHIVKLSDSIQALTIQQQSGQRLLEETRSTVKGLTDAYATAQKAATNLPPAPNPKLSFDPQIKGVTVASEDGHCLIRFDSAFFGRGVHFKVGSKGLLDAIAKSLVQTQEKLNVEIIGYADQEPPFWPWSARVSPAQLALDRAERVKLYLRHLNIFPANALTATNGTPTERSFSTDGISNRTVIIRISGQ